MTLVEEKTMWYYTELVDVGGAVLDYMSPEDYLKDKRPKMNHLIKEFNAAEKKIKVRYQCPFCKTIGWPDLPNKMKRHIFGLKKERRLGCVMYQLKIHDLKREDPAFDLDAFKKLPENQPIPIVYGTADIINYSSQVV